MNYLESITSALSNLGTFEKASVAAMCAESMSKVIEHLAQPVTQNTFSEGLDVVWSSVQNGVIDSRAAALQSAIRCLPESDCDDSTTSAYDVMISLGVLSYALDAIVEENATKATISACTLAANYFGGCDSILDRGKQSRRIDPRNPPSPAFLESFQIKLQQNAINEAQKLPYSVENSIKRMHIFAIELASELEKVFPAYIDRCGWESNKKR